MSRKIINSHRNNGLRIQMLRKQKGLTQRQLAAKLGISAVYMGYIEQGREKPSLELLTKIKMTLDKLQKNAS